MPKASRAVQILNVVTLVLMLATLYLVFFYAPREKTMGEVQRIFYVHVPSAWLSMAAFGVTAVFGGLYLWLKRPMLDIVANASVEIGLFFTVMAMTSGSIWAYPAWNTWWTWDPRLTTYTIMGLIYVAYVMLRQGLDDPQRRARFAAVYGIIGFISVPITFMSIRWWRTIHPVVIGGAGEGAQGSFAMTTSMVQVLLFANLAFIFLFVSLLISRVRLAQFGERVEQLKARLLAA